MSLIFWLVPILFLTLNPAVWKSYLAHARVRGGFILIQVLRFIVGLLYALFLCYVVLLDQTWSGLIACMIWVVGILMIVDAIVWKWYNMDMPKFLGGAAGGILLLVFLYTGIIYPNTIYRNLFSIVKAEQSEKRLDDMNIQHIVVVPLEYAKYKGEKLMGQIKNYSYYKIGSYSKQKINERLYWVAPIEFEGLITSQKAGTIPGYIRVSAEDESQNAELITGYEMKYVPSAYYGEDLERRVRTKYPDIVIMEASFEPDDTGKPYYAVTYGHFNNYRRGRVVDGVILFDPQTGEMTKYGLNEIPDFVDQLIPADVAGDYNLYYGEYEGGFWNRFFTKKGLHTPTVWGSGEEVIGVYASDNHMYWFTDHTTVDSEATSMVGYSLIDARSGKFTYYTGAKGFLNGHAALEAVNNSFRKDNWTGTQPILYNIFGQDTWVVPVIDANGLFREISLVHAESGGIAHAVTKKEAFDQYKLMLATDQIKGNAVPTNVSNLQTVEGTVKRVSSISTQDGTIFKLLLEGQNKIFSVNATMMPYVVFTHEGDAVSMKYIDNNEITVTVREFENKTLGR